MGELASQTLPLTGPATVLVVDDEVLLRLTMAENPMASGFRVVQASHADEALKILSSSQRIDCVLTDVRMPGSLNGLELAGRIRQLWPHLKVVIVSGEQLSEATRELAHCLFRKPVEFPAMLKCINWLLRPREPESHLGTADPCLANVYSSPHRASDETLRN
jgi:two-component system, response regulator PdtaR